MKNISRLSSLFLVGLTSSLVVGSAGCTLADMGSVESSDNSGGASPSGNGGSGGMGSGGSGGMDATSSSSSVSSGSGGAMTGNEDCSDKADNDNDGQIDCGDSDCVSIFSCAPAAPAGWSYVRIRQTTFGGATEPCGNGLGNPVKLYEEPDDGSCNKCSCNMTGMCSAELVCHSSMTCTGSSAATSFGAEAGCQPISFGITPGSCSVSGKANVPVNSSCSANGSGLKNDQPFAKELHLCLTTSKADGCGGDSCVFKPAGTYENRLCVSQKGSLACPVGFPEQHVAYENYTDNRGCSACSCDKSQATCSGPTTFTLWTDNVCTKNAHTVSNNNACTTLSIAPTYINVIDLPTPIVPDAGCLGGSPTGTLSPTSPVTVCCAKP